MRFDPARLATAGGVVFTALQDGWVVAYNDETLEELWRFNVGTPLKGAPVTYAIGPKQYLAVQAGGRHLHPVNWDKLENSATCSSSPLTDRCQLPIPNLQFPRTVWQLRLGAGASWALVFWSCELRHSLLVRITHWLTALSVAGLLVSGVAILIAHPRLYWGETGSLETSSLIDLPLTLTLGHSGWGRYLHFLSAWICVLSGLMYVVSGLSRIISADTCSGAEAPSQLPILSFPLTGPISSNASRPSVSSSCSFR